jgi:hypothetical protein
MISPMSRVNEIVSGKIGDYLTNVKTWNGVMYNVLQNGLVGDGVTDDTAALQTLINTAISAGRKAIFFPHTSTGGEYFVTALTNADQVIFIGDNASFVGGYTGTIKQFGDWLYTWDDIMYNVLQHGLVGDGVTNDTTALQTIINTAISAGRKAIFFPHTSTGGQYRVTALTNADQVVFFGDNASFVGGYTGTINQLGDWASSERLEDIAVNVKSFGAKGDGVTNDAISIQAALNKATTDNLLLFFPAGDYLCGSQITSSGENVDIIGAGFNTTRIIFNAVTGGFSFSLLPQSTNQPPQQLKISNLTIESRAAVSSPAISATWTAYQPNAQGQLWINNVNITRADNGTGTFTKGISLTNCIVGFISDSVILGDDARVSQVGIDMVDCVGIRIARCDVNRFQTGIRITKNIAPQSEGIIISDSFVYDINAGIYVNTAIHIQIINTHVNINGASATRSIEFISVNQSNISLCNLYVGGKSGDPTGQRCIMLTDSSNVIISNNSINGITKANSEYGILVFGNSDYNSIGNNYISSTLTATFIASSTAQFNQVVENQLFNNTTKIVDSGTSNYVQNNIENGLNINGIQLPSTGGSFGVGEISVNANWGAFIRGRSGTTADVALVDSLNNVVLTARDGSAKVKSYAKASLPSAAVAGGIIYVSDDAGGAVIAFSDGTSWRRVTDRAVIS